ncbi:ABSCISIC ACID-INSENSITIVE 5 protein [Nymphaea thermarum]|nr:ABSCISIC ACID-INSENSITIVE 5 protein [Nymphaea thermarum]
MSSDTDSRGMLSVDAGLQRSVGSLSLARQPSIYSLTLDEFQNQIGEPGKNFGSMNMDEFISNIWTAEESHAMSTAPAATSAGEGTLPRQASLPRQGSFTLPGPLGRKTVDEVWSEIHRDQQQQQQQQDPLQHGHNNGGGSANPVHTRQPTFGEMTLEDFLIKAGVVRDDNTGSMFRNEGNAGGEPDFGQVLGLGYGDRVAANGELGSNRIAGGGVPGFPMAMGQQMMQHQLGVSDVGIKRMGNGCLGGRAGNGGITMGGYANGGFGGVGAGSPASPLSSEGLCTSQIDCGMSPVPYGVDVGMRGRKRTLDGPVEKVVERRQRRMIKNRESAARSRARKQAYTVELEAELNHLKEENMRLRKLQLLESPAPAVPQKKKLRRTHSGPW